MENVLSFPNSHTEPWLSLGSILLGAGPDLSLLSAMALLLLLLFYLFLKPRFSAYRKDKDAEKQQGRANRRRSEASRGQKTDQDEQEEGKKLLSILKSPSGQHYDITHFRQLLCPDPLCEVCNTTAAKVSRLLSQASLEDAAHATSRSSPITSETKSSFTPTSPGDPFPASLTETSLLSASILPPSQVTSLVELLSPSAQGDSAPPEPGPPLESRLPEDQFPLEPLALPPSPPHHTQEKETLLQPEATLSSDDGSGDLSTSHLSSVEASFGGHSTACQVEPGSVRFLKSDNSPLLEGETKMTDEFLMCIEQEKGTESSAKQYEPDRLPTSSGEAPESAANQQCSALSHPLPSSEGKPEELHTHQKPTELRNVEAHSEQKCSQLCHLLDLPRQLQNLTVTTSGDCFSAISKISKGLGPVVLPHTPPVPLPEAQLQPSSHPLPQLQSQHLHLMQAQDQLESPTPVLLKSALDQNRSRGVCLHSTQRAGQSLTLSEIHDPECGVLLKVEKSVWRSPSVVQKSQEDFCPPASKLPSVTQSSSALVPVSILPRYSTFDSKLRKKLEQHPQRMLIQHEWGAPPRVLMSPSAPCPQRQSPVMTKSEDSGGLPCVSLLKGQGDKELKNFEVSRPSFHEGIPEMLPVKEGVGKRQGRSPEMGPKDNLLSYQGGAPENFLGSDSDRDLGSHPEGLTGKTSCMSLKQKQYTKALEAHLCHKFEEICKGHIPDPIHRSRNLAVPLLEKSTSQITVRRLAPLVGKSHCLDTSKNISFLSDSKQKMLEEHIKTFHSRMICGLPHGVQKSKEIFSTKKDPSQALSDSHFPSSDNKVCRIHPKIGLYKPLGGGANAFQAYNVTKMNSNLDGPCPAISFVGKEGQEAPRWWSSSSTSDELTANIRAIKDATQTFLPPCHKNVDQESQKQTLQAQRSPRLPTRLAGAVPDIRDKRMSSDGDTERLQSKMTMKVQHFPTRNKSREAFKAQELCAPQSQPSNLLITSKSEGVVGRDVNTTTPETSLTTERPLRRAAAIPQDLPEFKVELFNELKFQVESRKQSQAQSLPTDACFASRNLVTKTLFQRDESTSYEDMAASQDNTKTHMEQGQEPWGPQYVSCKYQDKKFPPAEKRLTFETGDPAGANAGLDAKQCGETSGPDQDRTLGKIHGSQRSPALSLMGQPPPENLRNKMRHFFQWPGASMKHRKQDRSKEKASALSRSAQSKDLAGGRAGFIGNTRDRRGRGFAKVLRQNLPEGHFRPPRFLPC